ncbi:carboxypeptidase B-like isoform X4 [Carcharodon carcharias]|uniref:carboxypeptidase B-like isoform X4 n=1 Tax=Carcharodon carcharias TaxID=13397 RepID=UPI001B7DCC94|nr:carboxypeptidase B-like isoform X4 [Carcharodon carcharias]XP_041031849.1 carboxypeptidase B-like isoform X4 [Carcharodon carcharias]
MEALLFLGFVAIISVEAAVGKYAGDKVLRLRPENEQHLQFIRHVSHSAEVDFWQPHSVELVTTNRSVDFRIGAGWASEVQAGLNKIGLKYDILIENVQNLMEKQFDRNKTDSTGYDYEKYHRWDEIESWIAKITIENPKLVSRFKIGHSYERRSIYLLRVGKRTGFMKPAIFLDCGIHAREWISPAFCQWFVKEAVRNYGSDPAMTTLLNKLDFLVVPVINVDGYVYSWARDRFWRKTRSRNPGSRCVGTDPNRNFDAKWCSIGASRDPCDDIYCGSHAESEKEVKAVAGFIRQYCCIKAYLTIHSYSQMCLFPYSYTYSLTPNYKELNTMASDAVKALSSLHGTQYEYGPAAIIIYPSAGGSDDWAYDLGIKYSFTFELRDTGTYGFLLPESQIRPTCEETMLAINYIATYVLNHPY